MAVLIALVLSAPCLGEDWSSYTPSHSVGMADADWWMVYPDQHESAGSAVDHPSWVLEALREKPLLIFIHSSNCKPCLTQIPRISSAVKKFSSDISYYDILAEESTYEKANQTLDYYGPFGGEQKYVPTTIFITLAEGRDGATDVAWHSQIDVMSQDEIESYIKDSIYYHKQSIDEWS
ncbi:MAG TPA: hypothetical protein PLN19_02895 [Methanothrix sp.]|nr:hypothetical protein [Methanothrix sp.]HOV81522.1 hypothetical protein [Methanothrix sp.]HPC89480.1 hypothetical protein [Methanothrix sp.]HQE87202.1 hypothetical protein [Methanothrix sp.]HQI68374.1 hypothetical protein [Methanothrix sp.]